MSTYSVPANSKPGGEAHVAIFDRSFRFDAGAERDLVNPGPAELLCSALAACLLKNTERYAHMLPFRYQAARVRVEAERQAAPPRFTRFTYRLEIVTDEPARRVELLHKNVLRYGTVGQTLSLAAEVSGEIVVVATLDE
jgi:uncharacterized OsmC-like protein